MQENVLQKILQELKKKGFKLTGPRLKIVEYLVGTRDHPGVQEVFEAVKEQHPGMGLATVYRTLDLLISLEAVKPLVLNDSKVRYEIKLPMDHHHHLICTDCGQVVEFGSCSFQSIAEDIERVTRFNITGHSLEAYGLCPQCNRSRETQGGPVENENSAGTI